MWFDDPNWLHLNNNKHLYILDFSIYTVHTKLSKQPASCSVDSSCQFSCPIAVQSLLWLQCKLCCTTGSVIKRCDTLIHIIFSRPVSVSLPHTRAHVHIHKYTRTISLSPNHALLSLTHSCQWNNTRTPDDINWTTWISKHGYYNVDAVWLDMFPSQCRRASPSMLQVWDSCNMEEAVAQQILPNWALQLSTTCWGGCRRGEWRVSVSWVLISWDRQSHSDGGTAFPASWQQTARARRKRVTH